MLKELLLSESQGESQEDLIAQGKSILQLQMERKKQEQEENSSLIGSVAKTMESRKSVPQKRSLVYIIGSYIYRNGGLHCNNDGSKVLNLTCSSYSKLCKGRVQIDAETLKVLKFRWVHSCTRDPDLKYQIQMENEMKNLAETTRHNLRNIFKKVCLKNPVIGKRIEYQNIYNTMKRRRQNIMK